MSIPIQECPDCGFVTPCSCYRQKNKTYGQLFAEGKLDEPTTPEPTPLPSQSEASTSAFYWHNQYQLMREKYWKQMGENSAQAARIYSLEESLANEKVYSAGLRDYLFLSLRAGANEAAPNDVCCEQVRYDSANDTKQHIGRVQWLLGRCKANLTKRMDNHDRSKLEEPEKSIFDEFTPKLKNCTYGSEEYKGFLEQMKPALAHHYAHNSHHPEHYLAGVDGMSLFDVIEMLCDWKAASERHADGSIERSLEVNQDRFKLSDQLCRILKNTARELHWLNEEGDE